jgi:hypothetical protein
LPGDANPGVAGGTFSGVPKSKEEKMKVNEGTIDRAVRILLGLALISLVYVGPKTPWGWVGILPLATGIVGFCGLYALLGINTCPMKRKDS